MGILQEIRRQGSEVWTKLSPGHRAILILLSLLCLGAFAGVLFWAGKPDYEILFTGLTAEECSTLVSSLRDAGIPVRVTKGGSALMVPSRNVNAARMVAAEEGLPKVGVGGFEAFREPKIGMTPFAERITYMSALQSELATTIMSLDPIVYARVHLALPEPTIFRKDAAKASASVLVVTKGGRRLTEAQVGAIANLIASGVKDLAPEDVTISDGKGNVLTTRGKPGAETAASGQWGYRQKVEAYLSEKAETMLVRILGAGRCEVRVSAELDFKDVRETRREYDGDKRVVIRDRIETQHIRGGSGMRVGGLTGTRVPGEGAATPTSQAGVAPETKTEKIDTEYVVSELVSEVVNRGATIKRLTVAVFVDIAGLVEEATGEEVAGGVPETAVPSPKELEEKITTMVKGAVGFNDERGDTFAYAEATFHPTTTELMALGGDRLPAWVPVAGRYGAVAILAFVLLLMARNILRSIEASRRHRVLTPEIIAMEGDITAVEGATRDRLISEQVTRYVEEDAEGATRLLEGWIEGEE